MSTRRAVATAKSVLDKMPEVFDVKKKSPIKGKAVKKIAATKETVANALKDVEASK